MKKLTKEKGMDIIHQKMDNSYFGEYNKEIFLVVSSWEEIEKVEKELEKYIEEDRPLKFDNLADFLEFDWGFDDEYATCSCCGKIVRTQPDSYSWVADFAILHKCELVCGECIKKDPEDYIEELKNNPRKANTILDASTLEEYGYKNYNGKFESGHYPGQTNSPEGEFEKLQDKYDVIFNIHSVWQFGITWEIYVKEIEKV